MQINMKTHLFCYLFCLFFYTENAQKRRILSAEMEKIERALHSRKFLKRQLSVLAWTAKTKLLENADVTFLRKRVFSVHTKTGTGFLNLSFFGVQKRRFLTFQNGSPEQTENDAFLICLLGLSVGSEDESKTNVLTENILCETAEGAF